MITEDQEKTLIYLEKNSIITTEDKNLRSKIDSLTRSLENLSQKKARLEFEIKRQKVSLTRKREELKRVSKRNSAKLQLSLESGILSEVPAEKAIPWLPKLDSKLLQESSLVLEKDS